MKVASIAAIVALAGCGADGKSPSKPVTAEKDSDERTELPPPSCSVAVNEFLWVVEVHDAGRVRDGLVGECIDGNWTSAQRRCVASATEPRALRACSVKSQVAIVLGSSGQSAELGIAECDDYFADYRRCVVPKLKVQDAKDTEEALTEEISIWRERLAKPGGALVLQRMCERLAKMAKRQLFRGTDCEN